MAVAARTKCNHKSKSAPDICGDGDKLAFLKKSFNCQCIIVCTCISSAFSLPFYWQQLSDEENRQGYGAYIVIIYSLAAQQQGYLTAYIRN